ncbi:unnamed protein product, partial [marine sediment metagenome]
MKKKYPWVLYVTHDQIFEAAYDAFSVTTPLRKKAFQKIGLKVKVFYSKGERVNFLSELLKILKFIKKMDIVYITVDGSSILEKFSLLKLFNPSLSLIWEIHGQVEEVFWSDRSLKTKLAVIRRNFKRKILSKLVDGSICLDEELKIYSEKQLGIKKSFVIPSFVDDEALREVFNSQEFQKSALGLFLKNKKIFKIIWGGGARFRWQAIDLIEKAARKIYSVDKKIIFLV